MEKYTNKFAVDYLNGGFRDDPNLSETEKAVLSR
jgi:hypothetical protein